MRVCALVTDLMDRSKISAAIPAVQFALAGNADVVNIDLARGPQPLPDLRACIPAPRPRWYGPPLPATLPATRPPGRRFHATP